MTLFCKHDWKILSEKVTESQLEQYGRVTGYIPKPKNCGQLEPMTTRKHICIVACSKCGELERFVEEI